MCLRYMFTVVRGEREAWCAEILSVFYADNLQERDWGLWRQGLLGTAVRELN